MKVQGTLGVDSRVEGQLDADHLILGESAVVKGKIKAKRPIIGSTIDGSTQRTKMFGLCP